MSVKENAVLLTGRDENGDKQLCYPITKLECVDGAEELAKKNDIAQADWDEGDETSPAYIKNKPEITAGITAVKVNGAALLVTNGAVDIPIPSVPTMVSDLQNDRGFISGEEFYGIEFAVNTMRNNLFLPMAEWDGDTTDHVNILGMFYKVSESTIVPPRVCITLAGRAADGSVSGGMTALSDGVMTDLAEMLGITIFIVENDPILVVAERAGVLPAAVIEQFMGTNPGADIPYEAGTYVFGQQDNNEFLFTQTAEGVMPIKDYIDAKIEEIKASLPG